MGIQKGILFVFFTGFVFTMFAMNVEEDEAALAKRQKLFENLYAAARSCSSSLVFKFLLQSNEQVLFNHCGNTPLHEVSIGLFEKTCNVMNGIVEDAELQVGIPIEKQRYPFHISF